MSFQSNRDEQAAGGSGSGRLVGDCAVFASTTMGKTGWQSLESFSVWASVFQGVIGAINSLLLVSEARDIFITSVLRHRLF